MNLIERYIFRRVFGLFLLSLLATTFIVLTTQVLLFVNVLTQSGQALSAFLRLALTLTPGMVMIVMPFALILGTSNTLNRMNTDSELAVLEAAGAGRKYVIKPILLLAVALTAFSLLLAVIVEPWSNRHRRDLLVAASADLLQIAIQSGTFRQLEDRLYVQVAEQYPGGGLGKIFFVDRRDESTELLYYADRGQISNTDGKNLILMSDGEIHRRDVASGDVSVITFASYALDLSQFEPTQGSSYYLPKERSIAQLLNPDPDDHFAKHAPHELRGEVHRRLSEWLYPLAFAFISVYFAGTARANRQERLWSMSAAFAIAFGLRGIGFAVTNQAGHSPILAAACYALPLATIAILAIQLFVGHVITIPQWLIERVAATTASLEAQRAALMVKLSGIGGRSGGAT